MKIDSRAVKIKKSAFVPSINIFQIFIKRVQSLFFFGVLMAYLLSNPIIFFVIYYLILYSSILTIKPSIFLNKLPFYT